MGHTYSNHLFHVVFSTKRRVRSLHKDVRERLFRYMCGIARNKRGVILRINGVSDHVHMLVKLSVASGIPKFVGQVKGNSSRWISETFPVLRTFKWQVGYSSFTVSESQWRDVATYIERQEEKHRSMSYASELARLLRKHNIEFDPQDYLD
ncbi:MAG: IS200/IS605 family transposase [Planctomycetes bacterium]|nr:IS200/IS605 family transposase [Planctomycetota bacterium]